MNRDDVAARVQTVFKRVFGTRVDFSPHLERAGEPQWTSLKHMELLVALELEFDLRFDGGDAVDMQSIPTVVERVATRLP